MEAPAALYCQCTQQYRGTQYIEAPSDGPPIFEERVGGLRIR
jgi:hypothetical protein